MRGDILARLAGHIVAQAMRHRIDPAERSLRPADIAKRNGVGGEHLEDRDRIGTGPFAQRPGLVPPDRAGRRKADHRHPAFEPDDRGRPSGTETEAPLRSVGERHFDPADGEPPADLVHHETEGRRREAG